MSGLGRCGRRGGHRVRRLLSALLGAAVLAGCVSSSRPAAPEPAGSVPVRIDSFGNESPEGKAGVLVPAARRRFEAWLRRTPGVEPARDGGGALRAALSLEDVVVRRDPLGRSSAGGEPAGRVSVVVRGRFEGGAGPAYTIHTVGEARLFAERTVRWPDDRALSTGAFWNRPLGLALDGALRRMVREIARRAPARAALR